MEIGDVIVIGGRQAVVCYTTDYNNEKYMCVAFDGDRIVFDIYKYICNERLMVSKVHNKNEMTTILNIFLKEGYNECGLPDELEKLINAISGN